MLLLYYLVIFSVIAILLGYIYRYCYIIWLYLVLLMLYYKVIFSVIAQFCQIYNAAAQTLQEKSNDIKIPSRYR